MRIETFYEAACRIFLAGLEKGVTYREKCFNKQYVRIEIFLESVGRLFLLGLKNGVDYGEKYFNKRHVQINTWHIRLFRLNIGNI